MMDKNYVRYLKESTRKIQARITGGNWQFGDHRRLKEQLAELAKYSKQFLFSVACYRQCFVLVGSFIQYDEA